MARTVSCTVRAAVIGAVWAGAILIPDVDSGAAGASTHRLNVKPSGGQSAAGVTGLFPSIDRDGTRVAFSSKAADLVPGGKDSGGFGHVFVRNLETKETQLVSVSSKEVPGDGPSYYPIISGNGKAVVFVSEADNLVPGDDNREPDVFLRNLSSGKTYLVSDRRGDSRASANGASLPAGISFKGHAVVFWTSATNVQAKVQDTNAADDVYYWTYDVDGGLTTKTTLVSHRAGQRLITGNGASGGATGGGDVGGATLSTNGDCAAFGSIATDLVSGVDSNGEYPDVYLACDLAEAGTPQLHRVSLNASGEQGNFANFYPSLGKNGYTIAYYSSSTNLVANDTNGIGDIFLAHLSLLAKPTSVQIVNRMNDGSQDTGGARFLGGQALSEDGNRVAFTTYGRIAGPVDCGGEQVYLRDIQLHTTTLMSVTTNGHCGEQFSDYVSISGDGAYVVWQGASTKLVSGDTNNVVDDFIRGPIG